MAWNFKFIAPSRAAAVDEVTAQEIALLTHFPSRVAEVVRAAILALPNSDRLDYRIETNGHISEREGNMLIQVTMVAKGDIAREG